MQGRYIDILRIHELVYLKLQILLDYYKWNFTKFPYLNIYKNLYKQTREDIQLLIR